MIKTCTLCNNDKPAEMFYSNRTRIDGLSVWCKECTLYKQKAKRERNLELARKKERKARKRYYKNNKRKVLDAQKDYTLLWTKNHPDRVRAYARKAQHKRRVWIAESGWFAVTKKDMARIMSGECYLCGSREKQTVDHIIPLSRGGRHSVGNLGTLCHSCNSRKRNKLLMEVRHEQWTNSDS